MQVWKEMELYCQVYMVSFVEINEEHFAVFVDKCYQEFCKRGIEDEFYVCLSEICRIVFAKTIINRRFSIDVVDFVNNLSCLENEFNFFINKDEVLNLQREILSTIKYSKTKSQGLNFKGFYSSNL